VEVSLGLHSEILEHVYWSLGWAATIRGRWQEAGMSVNESEVEVKSFGEYIVADPRICHGKLTFRGTRILVHIVLAQVARGMEWDEIVREWRGSISKAAIADAVTMAGSALYTSVKQSRFDSLTLGRPIG